MISRTNQTSEQTCCDARNKTFTVECGKNISCSSLCDDQDGGTFCPSGDCSDCAKIDDNNQNLCTSASASGDCGYCTPGCPVRDRQECCLHPECSKEEKAKRHCEWLQNYVGWYTFIIQKCHYNNSGDSCLEPDSVSRGAWDCSMEVVSQRSQELGKLISKAGNVHWKPCFLLQYQPLGLP